jgi:F-type H+-transporting ATPase subunit epsilon
VSGFTLHLRDALRHERVDGVRSFVGEDASGSFGILPGHARFVTVLRFGLARFRRDETHWEYLALPGAVLRFDGRELHLGTRRYLRDDDYERVSADLNARLRAEENELHAVRESLRRIEDELFRRMWQLGHERLS